MNKKRIVTAGELEKATASLFKDDSKQKNNRVSSFPSRCCKNEYEITKLKTKRLLSIL